MHGALKLARRILSHSRLTIRLTPRIDAVADLLDRVEAYAEATALPRRAAHRLALICEELAANVAMHGGPDATYIEIAIDREGDRLFLSVEDDGLPFDPCSIAPADTAAPLEQRESGGLGIHFIRSMVETLAYARSDRVNRLTAVLGTAE